MKIKNIACVAALLLASLSAVKAQTSVPITAWTFDNVSLGYGASPAPSTGFGTASAVGLGNSTNPSVVSLAGSSSGAANSWQFSATGNSGGWQTTSAIGTQGAQFTASTVGYYQIQVSFDVNATANAEGALQVQYTTGNSIWYNATITSVGSGATIANNTATTNSLVVGSYVTLASGWNNQITVNLTGISQVDDAPNFAIRIVNASTGTNCLDTTGVLYNNSNTTAAWTIDNVNIQGVPFTAIANWPFDNIGKKSPVNNPAPAIANNPATAAIIGFNFPTNFIFADGSMGSTNTGDVTANGQPYSSTGAAGQFVWRLRGQSPGNGWNTAAPIGAQGAEFDVSTINYSNIVVTFDLYMTSQGEAKMCVLYTTNGWVTTNIANNLSYGLNETLITTNANPTADPNTVAGTYFDNTYGSIFFNYMVVDFAGVPAVAGNPNFAFRIVNAATGHDCVNYLGQPYNNSSGNSRVDNIAVSGQFEGQYPPAVTNSSTATVDGPFTNTFAINANWATNISTIYINGVAVTNKAYAVTSSNIVFTPSKSSALESSGLDSIVINATNFASARYSQFIATGKATQLIFVQPAGPSASSGTLTANPYVELVDQFTNGTDNPYTNLVVTASVSNSPATWVLGGSTTQPIVNGFCTFTDLTATVIGSSAVSNAVITFAVTGYTNTVTHTTTTNIYSTSFVIGPPPVAFTKGNLAAIQIDTLGNNTTFSVIELKPSAANQTAPVNIVPISATGTNGLRLSSAASCGKLALSDDGTFLVFNAFQDNSSATADETFNLNRAVGTLYSGIQFTSPVSYVSQSFGGSQARAACSPDNQNFLIDDKGGLYVNNNLSYIENNVSVRSFGGATNLPGTAWVLTAKTATPPTPSLFQFAGNSPPAIDWENYDNDGPVVGATTPPPDEVAQDFYMVSTNIAYICDQSGGPNGTNGIITKWQMNNDGMGDWTDIGSWTNIDNCDTLFATTNGSGGVYLYYANGTGGQGGNQLIRLTDQTVQGALNIITTNVIYTAPATASIEGIVFVPQSVPYTNELTPPPILTAETAASTNYIFTITNTPDDPAWRSSITSITVNGTTLPPAAYNPTVVGGIVFDPSQSALLSPGSDTIVITATGYSTNTIVQTLGAFPVPIVSTLTASNVTAGSAILDASVNPDGGATAYWFEYGTNTSYGTITSKQSLPLGTSPVIVTNLLTGLLTGTTYHYAIVATNTTGLATGSDVTFTTLTVTPPDLTAGGGGSVSISGTSLTMSFTNTPGTSFSVLGTNNLTAPVSTWPLIGHTTETPVGSGNYSFSLQATNAGDFYIFRQP